MSLTYNRVQQEAQAIQAMAERLIRVITDAKELVDHDAAVGIAWNVTPTPTYIEEDLEGNLSGYAYSRQDVNRGLRSFDAIYYPFAK